MEWKNTCYKTASSLIVCGIKNKNGVLYSPQADKGRWRIASMWNEKALEQLVVGNVITAIGDEHLGNLDIIIKILYL